MYRLRTWVLLPLTPRYAGFLFVHLIITNEKVRTMYIIYILNIQQTSLEAFKYPYLKG